MRVFNIISKLLFKGKSHKRIIQTILSRDLNSKTNKKIMTLDEKGYGGAILMDLSKAFDTLNHELLITKLNAYGFSHDSLRLLYSYLSNRWQRTKINNTYSSWSEILLGIPQGSILGPLLFNIYLNDLFFINIESDLCSFADDNTLHLCDLSLMLLSIN